MRRASKQKDDKISSVLSERKTAGLSDALIEDVFAPFGLVATPELCEAIRRYTALLLRWNEKINLTAIREPREILERHFAESLYACAEIREGDFTLVDVGSGAGFPGLAIKLVRPGFQVLLIEPSGKKCAFLGEVVRSLGLENVQVLQKEYGRVSPEDIQADYVTVRALRPDAKLLAWSSQILTGGGRLLLWVGSKDAHELSNRKDWNWKPISPIPGSRERVILIGEPARN
jgi:16S rRNA (guanine527-N7)-methyltransferase